VVDGAAVVDVTVDGGIATVVVAAAVSDLVSPGPATSTRLCEHDASRASAIRNARPR